MRANYFAHGPGAGFGRVAPQPAAAVGFGDPEDDALTALTASTGTLESDAQNYQAQALSTLGGAQGQLASYQQQGQQIVNQAQQVVNDPTGPAAQALAQRAGVTVYNAAGGGQFGTVGRIAAGTIAGIASGLAMGGPVGAVAGGVFGFIQSVAAAGLLSNVNCDQNTGAGCQAAIPGFNEFWAPGTPEPTGIFRNLYAWRQTFGPEGNSQKPLGYGLYLAWTQVDPTVGTRRGCVPVSDQINTSNFTAMANGWAYLSQGCNEGLQTDACPPFTDSSVDYNERERPPTSVPVTQTARGPISTLLFNSISEMAGGDTQAQVAVARLPPNSFLDALFPSGSSAQGACANGALQYIPPAGYYAAALMTVLGMLTIGASDQAIVSELQSQLYRITASGQQPNDPRYAAIIAWFQGKSGVLGPPVPVAPDTTTAAAAGGLAAALVAAPTLYALATKQSVGAVWGRLAGRVGLTRLPRL